MMAQALRGEDAEARLTRALKRHAAVDGVALSVERCRLRPWSSATFEGAQLALTLALVPAGTARDWLEALPEADLPMRGHVAMPPAVDEVAEREEGVVAEVTVLVLIDA